MHIPMPVFTLLSGGSKAEANKLVFQEFFLMPVGAKSFREAMKIGCETFIALRHLIEGIYGSEAVANSEDGSFAPTHMDSSAEALKLIEAALDRWELNNLQIIILQCRETGENLVLGTRIRHMWG